MQQTGGEKKQTIPRTVARIPGRVTEVVAIKCQGTSSRGGGTRMINRLGLTVEGNQGVYKRGPSKLLALASRHDKE